MRTTGLMVVGTIVALAVIWGVYDLGALLNWWGQDVTTLSQWFQQIAFTNPIIPFFFGLTVGLLAGHFFWNVAGRSPKEREYNEEKAENI